MIDQIAIVWRTRVQKKILVLEHAETAVLEPSQRIATGLLNVQVDQFYPRTRVQCRNAQARHERKGALTDTALGVSKYNGKGFGQRRLTNVTDVF